MSPGPPPFTRFQRILLGTDGTVTHILEAYAGEPIEVVKLLHERGAPSEVDADLDVDGNDEVLRRQVLLRGRHSRRNLLYAEAVVALGRVEAAFLEGLVTTDKPIGVLLAERRTETFREILHVGRERAGAVGTHFGLEESAAVISRRYRIVHAHRPVILITERFPADFFLDVGA